MPRAKKNDLCEIFGYAPDDRSVSARKQWKSQECPFVGGICIKHSHPQADGVTVVYGTCSVLNRTNGGKEEVILCPQRLYANDYATIRACMTDALGGETPPIFTAHQYGRLKRRRKLPKEHVVILGKNSGGEIALSNPGVIELSLDWVLVYVTDVTPRLIVPVEVQSIDTTGNYHVNWRAYAEEKNTIPDSRHGMNWANVWKRIIPQLILKSAIASTSKLCTKGLYFVVPDRVYVQFEKVVGKVDGIETPTTGSLTVMTYCLGPNVPAGEVRELQLCRQLRMKTTEFAESFASGRQMPLGSQLDDRVTQILRDL